MAIALLPPILISKTYTNDIKTFWYWSESLQISAKDVYSLPDRQPPNYGVLGIALSGGALSLFKVFAPTLTAERAIPLFRVYLGLFDFFTLMIAWRFLRKMHIPKAFQLVVWMGILPSFWLSGSVWGQVDGATQLLLMTSLVLGLNSLHRLTQIPVSDWVPSFIGGWAAGIATLLIKELALFFVPALILLYGSTLVFAYRHRIEGRKVALLAFAALPILLLLGPDLFLNLPSGYRSHLQFIYATGDYRGYRLLQWNGFNIWLLLFGWSSRKATDPWLGPITPFQIGLFLFIATMVGLSARWLWAYGWPILRSPAYAFSRSWVRWSRGLLLYFALTQLAFNLWLTGTHERYLHHFYPYLWLAVCLGVAVPHSIVVLGAAIYAIFLSYILAVALGPGVNTYIPATVCGVAHLLLFSYLLWKYVRETGTYRRRLTSP